MEDGDMTSEALQGKVSLLQHFDEKNKEFAQSLLTACTEVEKCIKEVQQDARSKACLIDTLKAEVAEAMSMSSLDDGKKQEASAQQPDDVDPWLGYLARVKQDGLSSSGPDVCKDIKKGPESPDSVLRAIHQAAEQASNSGEAMEALIHKHQHAARNQQAGGPLSCLDHWMQRYLVLAKDETDKENKSDVPQASSAMDAAVDLSVYEALLDKQIQRQRRTLEQRKKQTEDLKQDLEVLEEVISRLKENNIALIDSIRERHLQNGDSACKKLELTAFEIGALSEDLRAKSEEARASLLSAKLPSVAEDPVPQCPSARDKYKDLVLQEALKCLQNEDWVDDSASILDRKAIMLNKAQHVLEQAAKNLRDKGLIKESEEALLAYNNIMKQDEAFLLLDGVVDGRTFAEWLETIMVLVKIP